MDIAANLSTFSITAWIVIGVLGVSLIALAYYMVRNKVSIGALGIQYKSNYSRIWARNRDIDDKYRLKNKDLIKSCKERFYSVFVVDFLVNKVLSALAAEKALTPLEESVDRNHYSRVFSQRELFKAWEKRMLNGMEEQVKLMRVYYDYEERVDWANLETFLLKILTDIKEVLVSNVIDSCIEKIHLYDDAFQETKDLLWQELKNKNQKYIDSIQVISGGA